MEKQITPDKQISFRQWANDLAEAHQKKWEIIREQRRKKALVRAKAIDAEADTIVEHSGNPHTQRRPITI